MRRTKRKYQTEEEEAEETLDSKEEHKRDMKDTSVILIRPLRGEIENKIFGTVPTD